MDRPTRLALWVLVSTAAGAAGCRQVRGRKTIQDANELYKKNDFRGAAEDYDQLARYRDLGVMRVVAGLAPEGGDKTLPALDRWAELIRKV